VFGPLWQNVANDAARSFAPIGTLMRSDRPWGRHLPWGRCRTWCRNQPSTASLRSTALKTARALQTLQESLTMALLSPSDKGSPETERRLSEGRSCAGCATSLQGRRPQAKFCSDRCRVRFARRSRLETLRDLRSRLDSSIAESVHIRAGLDRLIGEEPE
jgi:hypothetical protein